MRLIMRRSVGQSDHRSGDPDRRRTLAGAGCCCARRMCRPSRRSARSGFDVEDPRGASGHAAGPKPRRQRTSRGIPRWSQAGAQANSVLAPLCPGTQDELRSTKEGER